MFTNTLCVSQSSSLANLIRGARDAVFYLNFCDEIHKVESWIFSGFEKPADEWYHSINASLKTYKSAKDFMSEAVHKLHRFLLQQQMSRTAH